MQNMDQDMETRNSRRNIIAVGVLLVAIGAFSLAGQWVDLGVSFLLGLGAAMLAWGVLTRTIGWIIPGGIVSGIGLGVLVNDSGVLASLSGDIEGAVFLLSMALGWFTIPLAAWLSKAGRALWALIPGGVMALVGGLVLMGEQGLNILNAFNIVLPVVLVLVGLGLILGLKFKK